MNNPLSSMEVGTLVWDCVRNSELANAVPTMYWHHHPDNPKGEFIIIWPLANAVGESQIAYVNVNIYVPDKTHKINGIGNQRVPDVDRLKELSRIAFTSLKNFPMTERWFFMVGEEVVLSEDEIPYSFISYQVKLKKY